MEGVKVEDPATLRGVGQVGQFPPYIFRNDVTMHI